MMTFAGMTIKGVLVLNGGAALALLAFLPQSLQLNGVQTWALAIALPVFGMGAFFGVLCPGIATLTQWKFTDSVRASLANDQSAYEELAANGDKWRTRAEYIAWAGSIAFVMGLILGAIGFWRVVAG